MSEHPARRLGSRAGEGALGPAALARSANGARGSYPDTPGPELAVPGEAGELRTAPGPRGEPSGAVSLTHRQVLVVLSGLLLGMFIAALDQTIVATALPVIVGDLHGFNHLSWVVTAYLLTSTASTPLYGKLSDLYGRKSLFQASIVVFLAGSALAGLSQNMDELIGFRALQGLGAGGLMALAMAIIGDIVSPRERGRYQGYFGATFALSSVGGPLLGGIFVDQLSWRWIFYVNIPIGLVALVVTGTVLRLPFARRPHAIDYTGSALLVAAVSALLLVTVWGGTTYPWGSGLIVGLGLSGLVLLVAFVGWERRVPEPILPPHLFRNSIFSVSNGLTFLMAMAMFGATIFLPVYFQLVEGVSPMMSGLLLLPLMAGVLTASIVSGNLVTRLGRYKAFPVLGTAVMAVGLYLLSHLGAHTSRLSLGADMVVVGLGMGMIMQVVVLAVQNAVDMRDLGTATSAVNFFRSMGGAFGTALFGAVLTARLAYWLPRLVPHTAHRAAGIVSSTTFTSSPAAVLALPAPVRDGIVEAFVRSLHAVFLVGVPVALGAFVLSLFLREIRLRETVHIGIALEAEGFALPSDGAEDRRGAAPGAGAAARLGTPRSASPRVPGDAAGTGADGREPAPDAVHVEPGTGA